MVLCLSTFDHHLYVIFPWDQAGSEDIKRHKWFRGVDWDALVRKQVQAPIIPVCAHPGDTRNFETYPEPGDEEDATGGLDPFRNLFRVSLVGMTFFRFPRFGQALMLIPMFRQDF